MATHVKKDKKNKKHSDTTQQPFQRNVFLDTQVFKTNNFNFDSYPLRILKERFQEDRASVFITEIVDHEVRVRMKREIEDAAKLFGPFSKEAKILFSVPRGALHKHNKKIDVAENAKSMNSAFDKFLAKLDVTTIPCAGVEMQGILEAYFSADPPFGPGDDKRREFPDAISLAAVAAHFKGEGGYVITEDKGLQEACKAYPHIKVLPRLEDFLSAELADHDDVSWITAALEAQRDELETAITEAFQEDYFYLDDQEGDVEKVEVEELESEDPVLIETTKDEGTVSVKCRIAYSAEISYDDPDMTVHSEGERYSFGTVDEEVTREEWATFKVTFQIDRVEKRISDFHCSSDGSRSISAIEYEDPR
jgi:hypothetical protein